MFIICPLLFKVKEWSLLAYGKLYSERLPFY